MKKIEELSIQLLRMCLENHNEYLHYKPSHLAAASLHTACSLLCKSTGNSMFMQEVVSQVSMTHAREEVEECSNKLEEFYVKFDTWHCGYNQLKRFKGLSFTL